MKKEDNIPKVYRISVDERLSEDLIRLEICELIKPLKSGEFKDEPENWEEITSEGEEIVVKPIEKGEKVKKGHKSEFISISESLLTKFNWKDLKEGQVYLSGEFEIKEKKNGDQTVKRFFIYPGKRAIEKIDDVVNKNTKTLYYDTLSKGKKNGKV